MSNGKIYSVRLVDLSIIDTVEAQISRVMNLRNLNYNEAIKFIFLLGHEELLKQPEFKVHDVDQELSLKISRALNTVQMSKSKEQNLYKLLGELGDDDFRKWCQEAGVDPEPIIGNYENNIADQEMRASKRIAAWLENELSDMLPHNISDIITNAQNERILPDRLLYPEIFNARLKTLRNVASVKGYSGKAGRGLWQKRLLN